MASFSKFAAVIAKSSLVMLGVEDLEFK